MIEIATALSAGEPFLRVIFSELTLRPDGGAFPFTSPEWEDRLGDWIELPGRIR